MNPMNQGMTNGSNDQEPDPQDPQEGSESEMSFSTADYPELEGLQPGNPIKMTCQGSVKDASNGQVTIAIDPGAMQFETEGQADKSMRQMSQQDNQVPSGSQGAGEDF